MLQAKIPFKKVRDCRKAEAAAHFSCFGSICKAIAIRKRIGTCDRNPTQRVDHATPALIDLVGMAQHIVQRGNDPQTTFSADVDLLHYLTQLNEITLSVGCHVDAYVLMTNPVHLLVTSTGAGRIAQVTQSLGRRSVRTINDRYHGAGTFWQDRYKACPVLGSTHLLRHYCYIELNPVRAAMVADPRDHRWSSYRVNALGQRDPLVHPHAEYLSLSPEPEQRLSVDQNVMLEKIDPFETDAIRQHSQHQHVYGGDPFSRMIEAPRGRRLGPATIDRPRKAYGIDAREVAL